MYINAIVFHLNNMQYVFFIINKRTVRSLKKRDVIVQWWHSSFSYVPFPRIFTKKQFSSKTQATEGQLKMQDSVTSRGIVSFKFTCHFCGQRPVIIEILC